MYIFIKIIKLDLQSVLNTHSEYESRSLSVPGVYISNILYTLLNKYWAELFAVVIKWLFRVVHVKKSLKHLVLDNKYLPFLCKQYR